MSSIDWHNIQNIVVMIQNLHLFLPSSGINSAITFLSDTDSLHLVLSSINESVIVLTGSSSNSLKLLPQFGGLFGACSCLPQTAVESHVTVPRSVSLAQLCQKVCVKTNLVWQKCYTLKILS